MDLGSRLVGRRLSPRLDRGVKPRVVGAEILRQRLEESDAGTGGQLCIFSENFPGQRHAGRLAAAGQKLLAQLDQARGLLSGAFPALQRAVEQRPAPLRDGLQHFAEKGSVHGGQPWVGITPA